MHPAFVAKLGRLAPERPAVDLAGGQAQRAFLERLATRAEAVGFASSSVHVGEKSATLDLDSGVKRPRAYSAERVRVTISSGKAALDFGWRSSSDVPIVDEEHAVTLLQHVRERLVLDVARAAKRAKLTDLRVRAFEGRLEAVAAARSVDYAIEGMHGKVQLALKLGERRSFVVDLPYRAELDEVDKIGPLYDDLRALFDRGLRFDLRSKERWAKWKKPRMK